MANTQQLLAVVSGMYNTSLFDSSAISQEHVEYNEFRHQLALALITKRQPTKLQGTALDVIPEGRIFLAGNGGSYADCLHFAAELTGRYDGSLDTIPCIVLGSNLAHTTAVSNDVHYNAVFTQELKAHRPGPSDVLILLSTSGTSDNVVCAVQDFAFLGLTTFLFTGPVDHAWMRPQLELNPNLYIWFAGWSDIPQKYIQTMHYMMFHDIAGLLKGNDPNLIAIRNEYLTNETI